MKKAHFLLLGLIVSFLLSCEDKEDPITSSNPEFSFEDGTIIVGPDSCGFLLSRPTESFKPENLSPQFQVSGLAVKGKYRIKSQNYKCGLKNNVFRVVRITEMQRR